MEKPTITLCFLKPSTPQVYEKIVKKIARFHARHPHTNQIDTTLWLEGISNNYDTIENIISLLKNHSSGKLTVILSGHGGDATISLLMAADQAIALPHASLQFNEETNFQQNKSVTRTATRIAKKLLENLTEKSKNILTSKLQNISTLELLDNLSSEGRQIIADIKNCLQRNNQITHQLKTKHELLLEPNKNTAAPPNLSTTLNSLISQIHQLKTHLPIIQWMNQTKNPDWLIKKIQTLIPNQTEQPPEPTTTIWQTALFTSNYLHTNKINLSAPDALKLGIIDKIAPNNQDPCQPS